MATTPFVPTSKYYVLTPVADNLDFLDFNLSYGNGSITDRGEHIQYNGSAAVDSVFVRPGLTYDLTNTGPRTDKIYLSGNLSDYTRSAADGVLILSRTVDTLVATGQYEEVRVANGTSFNFDNLVFANGSVNANTLYNDVANGLPLPTPDPTETSVNPQGAARPGAPLSATIKAYSTNAAGIGQVGETFASVKAGMSLTINGGNGIDSAYVADGEILDATVTGASVDLIYMRGNWADYAKQMLAGTNNLQLTRLINGSVETVTVNAGTAFNYDRLIFADGAITTIAAKQTTDPGFVGPVILDPSTKTPLYTDDEVQTALNAIRDAAQGDSASSGTPSALTYLIAGVSGVDGTNLPSINSALDTAYVTGARADTAPEIQTIVNGYKAILAEANGAAANPNPLLTGTPYTDIGVTGVSGTAAPGNALYLLDDVVNNSSTAAVDTVPEIQALADAAARVIAAAGGTTTQAAAITPTDLANLGVAGVGPDNIGAVRAAIQASAPGAVDTQAEIQALVTLLPPAAPTINVVAGDDVINLSEVNSTITGTNQVGDSVTLTIGGLAHAATVTGGTWSYMLQPVDLFLMGQGPDTISATQTNANHVTSAAVTRNISVDTIAPTATLTPGTLAPTASATVQSSEVGTAYLVNSSLTVTNLSSITGAADNQWNSVAIGTPNSNTGLGLAGLQEGSYRLYTVDAAGNLSAASSTSLSVATPATSVNISAIPAITNGFAINGILATGASDQATRVYNAGDVNGDGLDDMLLGASGVNGLAGATYVVFGKTDTTAINVAAVAAGTGGFVINGIAAGDQSGIEISAAGDLNGDGLSDILVGAWHGNFSGGTSAAYVVYGKADTAAVNLSAVAAGIGGFGMTAPGSALLGSGVGGAGDVNGDGLADFIVGAWGAGKSYVVFGKANNTNVDLAALEAGIGGFVINEVAGSSGPWLASGTGDVNGDGLADLLIGNNSNPADAYVVYGKTSGTAVDLGQVAAGIGGFLIRDATGSNASGHYVIQAGDVNGDGLADVIVAGQDAQPGGISYVVFGKNDSAPVNLDDVIAGTGGFVIRPRAGSGGSGLGITASDAGDMNGDGLADMVVSEIGATGATRAAYVVYGKTDTSAVNLDAVAAGTGGFALNWDQQRASGFTTAHRAGDVNGDGLDDLMVASYTSNIGTETCYIIFGGTQFARTVDFYGRDRNDTFTGNGTPTAETFIGGAGDDTLIGNGGADVMYGGAGNDTFVLNASNTNALQNAMGSGGNISQLARVNGGTGTNTIQLTGGASLDLTHVSNVGAASPDGLSRISSIEIVDLKTDAAANTLTLRANDVIDMSGMNVFNSSNTSGLAATVSKHQVAVFGDASDTLNIDVFNWNTTGAVVNYAGHNMVVYNSNTSAAQLLVEQAMVTASHVI